MRSTTSALIAAATLGLLLVGSGSAAAPVTARAAPVIVSPDFNRTKAFFITINARVGSISVPTLNGLTGTITYNNSSSSEKAKVYTAWGTYGNPPPPSNGGAIVAYVVVHLTFPPAVFLGGSTPKSSVSYAKLIPSKAYSVDLFDCTANTELRLLNIGSPSNNMLTFISPLQGIGTYSHETLCLELVQNP